MTGTGGQLHPGVIPPVGPLGPSSPLGAPAGATAPQRPQGPTFGDVLARSTQGIQFSNHAVQRVQRRGIEVTPATLQRLDGAVQRAAAKGARESVVFVDGTAFVVSVRNRTVITAVDPQSMREHVFTNIDSAVIA